MKKFFSIAYFIGLVSIIKSQGVIYHIPPDVDSFVKVWASINLYQKYGDEYEGYRIQVTNTKERTQALYVKKDMQELLPSFPVFLTYKEPYYRLRVGCFAAKIDAEKWVRFIDNYYNKKYALVIVPEIISLNEILQTIYQTDYSSFY